MLCYVCMFFFFLMIRRPPRSTLSLHDALPILGNADGMAMAARRERGLLDPDAPQGESLFDHTIWAFASDGDLEEGVSGEASSLAGTQELGNLVLVYDDNRISIEDDTTVAFTEDVGKRYEAYGWHVQRVDDGRSEVRRVGKVCRSRWSPYH